MLISPHHNYNCNYTTLQLRHRLVRYYWYVYLYIYIYRTLYSICNWLAVSNLQFKFQYQDDPFDDCTCYTFTPAVYQSWEAAGLSPYFEVHPTWSFHGAQIIPGSTTIQLPTHQTNPAIELGGWHWKCPSVIWGDDILLRNIWACCISCEGSQSIGIWWNKTTKTTWNHGFPGFPKKRVPSIYGIYCSKLGNLLQNFKYAGINTVFFHVFPCLFNHRFIHAVDWSFP